VKDDTMRHIETAFLCIFMILRAFAGGAIIDAGCDQFNFPTYPFADLAGAILDPITFTIQSGPVKEFGVNGCQIDDVIAWAKDKIEQFNATFPCRENSLVGDQARRGAALALQAPERPREAWS
jgi:hypothetical protein